MALTSPVIEFKGYGEASTPNTTSTPAVKPVDLQEIINQMVQAGINQWKYKLALKMAKEPCKKDPAHCGYYIAQAMRSLGLTPPPGLEQVNQTQASQIDEQLLMASPTNKQDNTLNYLLLGGGIIAGILLMKYLSERS